MNLMYILLLGFFLAMNSCQKDQDVFSEVLKEETTEPNEGNTGDGNTEGSGQTGNGEKPSDGVLKAFPTAYGGGSQATGGRGKKVFFVTNLEDAGPGSFRQALIDVGNNGGGNILFRVSGTIELKTRTFFSFDNVTIAGQTAPAGGIDLTGKGIVFENCNNVIIRHLRFRPDYAAFDAASFISCKNLIIDHCSLSWGGDETISFWSTLDNISAQRLLVAEGKTGTILGDSDDPSLSKNLSLHNSLYYNISHRFPNPNSNGRIDVLNNVVFNWKYRLSTPTGNPKLNHINNYYSPGCLTSIAGLENKIFEGDSPRVYTAGNYVANEILTDSKKDNWFLWRSFYANKTAPIGFKVRQSYNLLGNPLPLKSAEAAFEDVTQDTGANKVLDAAGNIVTNQDALDLMFLSNTRAGDCIPYQSSSYGQDYENTQHYRDYHLAVSNVPRGVHPNSFDTDQDGMPDTWEVATFGNLSRTGKEDADADGYTDLEEYLNLVDNPI